MIRKILRWPNSKLYEVSRPVDIIKDQEYLRQLIADMEETMVAAQGLGLSAIQIGIPERIFVICQDDNSVLSLINPEIVELKGNIVSVREGCLSLPGIFENVRRHTEVRTRHWNLEGEEIVTDFFDLEAQVVQHESEHLDGRIFIQQLPMSKRDKIRKILAKRK